MGLKNRIENNTNEIKKVNEKLKVLNGFVRPLIPVDVDALSTKIDNINRVKLNYLRYAITYGVAMPSDELYETCEDKCQALYSVITGGLN